MQLNKVLTHYYSLVLGVEPSVENYNRTENTVKYLLENYYTANEIFDVLRKVNKECITGEDLPIDLWDNSLLEKGKYYYSEIFHIKPSAPTWNPVTMKEDCSKFFLEMKIRFTLDDLLDYYYDKCRVMPEIRQVKKDKASLSFLINKYNKFKVPGIDYVVGMINKYDSYIEDKPQVFQVYDIEKYAMDVITEFEKMYDEASFHKTNEIVWRS